MICFETIAVGKPSTKNRCREHFPSDSATSFVVLSRGFDPNSATGRQKHHEPSVLWVAGTAAPEASTKEKMQEKLRTPDGKALYAARKHIIEPVFGMFKSARGIRRFLVRGLEKVAVEWKLTCLTHNLLKIWRHAKIAT